MLPDKVDHLLEELEQRLVLADTAPNHHAGVVLSGQRLDDRCFGVLVGCHQAQVGLATMIAETGLTACYRRHDRLRIPARDSDGIETDQHSPQRHASSCFLSDGLPPAPRSTWAPSSPNTVNFVRRACHTIPMLPQVVPDVLDSRPPGPTPFVLSSASGCLGTRELRQSRAPALGPRDQNGAGPRPTSDTNTCVASTFRTFVTATAPTCSSGNSSCSPSLA